MSQQEAASVMQMTQLFRLAVAAPVHLEVDRRVGLLERWLVVRRLQLKYRRGRICEASECTQTPPPRHSCLHVPRVPVGSAGVQGVGAGSAAGDGDVRDRSVMLPQLG